MKTDIEVFGKVIGSANYKDLDSYLLTIYNEVELNDLGRQFLGRDTVPSIVLDYEQGHVVIYDDSKELETVIPNWNLLKQ